MAAVSNLKLADRANKKFLSMVLWGWPDVIGPLVSFILDPAAACDFDSFPDLSGFQLLSAVSEDPLQTFTDLIASKSLCFY